MKIAIAQLNPTIGDIPGNAAQILTYHQQALASQGDLLLTPELSLCGYPPKDLLLTPGFIQALAHQTEELAQKLQIPTLVGTVSPNPHSHQEGEKPLHNTMVLLQSGQMRQSFAKRLLPTYDVFDEDRYFAPGKESKYCSLSSLKVGVTICEDIWNDEQFWGRRQYQINPIAELAMLEVDLIINLSASPYSLGKQKTRENMIAQVARRYQVPIIYVNQVGGNDDLIFDGRSVAFNRRGELMMRGPGFQEDLLMVEYDIQKRDLLPGVINPLETEEEGEIWQALILGLKDYVGKCGFKQVVLGLSGGIDSSLVAAIAAAALGPEQVLGVMMPSPYSSHHSLQDAQALVDNLGINSYQIPIVELMKAYDHSLESLFQGTEFGIAEENLQSRIRGTLLMAIANKFGYLLLATGNKSEMAVGYCTLYGDMNGGLAVIADLPKTKVFALCNYLNREREVIPYSVITKPPSAELKPNQIDQDSLPPYEILDDILEKLVHHHQSLDQIVASGHDPGVVKQVMGLVFRSEFKRKQAPPGLKITDRAFGTGWRMPIASRW